MLKVKIDDDEADAMGDNHVTTSSDTPLRADAFAMDDDLKIELIEEKFAGHDIYLGLESGR
jgi:GTP cyclohydrolase I